MRARNRTEATASLTEIAADPANRSEIRQQAQAFLKDLAIVPAGILADGACRQLDSDPDAAKRLCASVQTDTTLKRQATDCVAEADLRILRRARFADIRKAWMELGAGNRAGALTLVKPLALDPDPKVAGAAEEVVKRSLSTWPNLLAEQLHANWLFQTAAAALLAAAILAALFAGAGCGTSAGESGAVVDAAHRGHENLGAADAIADAIRRTPVEVKKPLFSPSSALARRSSSAEVRWGYGRTSGFRPALSRFT